MKHLLTTFNNRHFIVGIVVIVTIIIIIIIIILGSCVSLRNWPITGKRTQEWMSQKISKPDYCCNNFVAADFHQLSSEEGRRQLRSADSTTFVVRRTYSNFGDRCFVAAPALGCGTAFQLVLGKRTSAMNSLSDG